MYVVEEYDDALDVPLFLNLMANEIQATEQILHILGLTQETPPIILACQLYKERLIRLQSAIDMAGKLA